jgi:hypothetical protein
VRPPAWIPNNISWWWKKQSFKIKKGKKK